MAGHIANSSNVAWNTRPDHLELVRKAFKGTIELDPCWNPSSYTKPTLACDLSNQNDGLIADWRSVANNAFVNPPFGTCWYNVLTGAVFTPEQFNGNPKKGIPAYNGPDRDQFTKSTIGDWIRKMAAEVAKGLEIITIVPAAVDTKHWQKVIYPTAQAVCYIEGRVRFYWNGQQGGPAPMACAFVYWGNDPLLFAQEFSKVGHVR